MMDQRLVDALARLMSGIPSRRTVLRGLVGGALGTLVGWPLGAPDAQARKRKRRRKKRRIQDSSRPGRCIPRCAPRNPCGPDGCGGSCGGCADNETCQSGQCVCVPQCAASTPCGPDGCGGSCGSCDQSVTCVGTTVFAQVCDAGTCKPIMTPCGGGQVCFENQCCAPDPGFGCRQVAVPDGCGGLIPPNCAGGHCCAGPSGDVCQATPCP